MFSERHMFVIGRKSRFFFFFYISPDQPVGVLFNKKNEQSANKINPSVAFML